MLLVGALAAGDLGIDFDGTDFAFLEQAPLLAVVVVLLATLDLRWSAAPGPAALEVPPWAYLLGTYTVVLGILYAAGSMADGDDSIVPGIIAGTLCAVPRLRRRARPADAHAQAPRRRRRQRAARSTPRARGCSPPARSVLFPPLAVLVIGGLLALLLGGRRRAGEKYAGLRILR